MVPLVMEPLNKIEQTFRQLSAEGRTIHRLFAGNPADCGLQFPAAILKEVYARSLEAPYRPHSKGLPTARRAIADYYARQGAKVDPENILLTSGTSESFFYIFSLVARPGDNILTPNPSYPLFDPIAKLTGVELRQYRLSEENGWAIDLQDLIRKTDDRTRLIVLISPHNPTGAVAAPEEIREVVAWANRKEIPLLCDEVFSEFCDLPFPRPMALAKPRLCFTLNGISKMFALPALKLGWIAVTGEASAVAPAVDSLETTADTFLSCHLPIQEALPHLFSEGSKFVESYRNEVNRRRRLAVDLLKIPQLRFVPPRGGFFLMAKAETRLSEEELVIRLMQETGVFVHPGYFYDYEKGVHLVMSTLIDEPRMRTAVASMARFLKGELI